ncbi:uncharacterized protein LOC117171728 [Belonocnema kinseyi]|uniref:uncharacterized protein LOC117171728 n=1 Tax=Belonocnema kinseyi TaxID=2817044 RepID=UPI00143D1520|nr:uncharacterized protein LOC117171728 [Belonocnema kinseyi]
MLTTDTEERKTDVSSYSDMFIVSLTQEPRRQVGSLKKPGSQHEKVYVPKHLTVNTDMKIDITEQNSDELRKKVTSNSYSPRQRFRSRSTSNRTSEIPKTEVPKTQGVQRMSAERNPEINKLNKRATTLARQRRQMSSLNR